MTIAVLLAVSSAEAAVIDFTTATNTGTVITTPEATVTAAPGTNLTIGDFIDNAVCPSVAGCTGAMELEFMFDVNNVAFEFGFGGSGDQATVTGFDSFGVQVGQILLTLASGTSFQSLATFGTLRSIVFDNTLAASSGYAYGNISYDRAAVIPLPATLPLLLAGIAGIGLMGGWRRTA
ncbi:MAG TPA: hypothetical protein VFJ13_05945 [Paracoccaceae bacterium]|nr:hypothetical protein [Paracoccaceae bacterium]